jgi:hypothetical protein
VNVALADLGHLMEVHLLEALPIHLVIDVLPAGVLVGVQVVLNRFLKCRGKRAKLLPVIVGQRVRVLALHDLADLHADLPHRLAGDCDGRAERRLGLAVGDGPVAQRQHDRGHDGQASYDHADQRDPFLRVHPASSFPWVYRFTF